MSDIDFSAFDDHPANNVDFSEFDAMSNNSDTPSMTESALRGGADMMSFGGAPKVHGAIHEPLGAMKQLANVISNGQVVDKADKDIAAYEDSKGAYKAADERAFNTNPVSYIGGGLGTGAILSLLSGGLAGAARGGVAAADAAALAAKLDKLQKAKGFFDKAEAGAKAGLAYGAARGAVSGEGRNLPEKGVDTAWNAGGGLVTGGLTSMGLSALGGAGKAVLGEKGVNAYDLGKKAVNLINPKTRKDFLESEVGGGAKDIFSKLFTGEDSLKAALGKNYQKAVDAAKDSHVDRVTLEKNLRDILKNGFEGIPGQEMDEQVLSKLVNHFLPPQSAAEQFLTKEALAAGGTAQADPYSKFPWILKLKKALSDKGIHGDNKVSTEQGKYVAGQLTKETNQSLENVSPGFNKANDDYNVYFENVLKNLGLKNEDGVVDPLVAQKRLMDALHNWGTETNIGTKTRVLGKDALNDLSRIDSSLAGDISEQLQRRGLNIQTARSAGNESSVVTGNNPWKTLMGVKYQAANGVGMGVNKVGNALGTTVNGVGKALENTASSASKKLATMPNSQLKEIAQHMLTHASQGVQNFGKILNEASQRDDVGKNALIFTLMQNDAYRSIADEIFGKRVSDSDVEKMINSQAEPTPQLK